MNFEHKKHDRLLVARFAAGDSYPSEQPDAEKLVAACPECAQLAADIRLLSARTSQMTAPRRPRDFRISAEQAERLRGNWLERAMRRLTAPGWGTLQPVAGAALALGLTLTVVGALPIMGGAAATRDEGGAPQDPIGMSATAAPNAPEGPGTDKGPAFGPGDNPAPPGTTDGRSGEIASADGTPVPMTDDLDDIYLEAEDGAGDAFVGPTQAASAPGNPLVLGGLAVATIALAILLLTIVARRRFADPLLR